MHYVHKYAKTSWPCLKENLSLREEPPTSMEIIPKEMKAQLKTWMAFQNSCYNWFSDVMKKIVFSLHILGPHTIKVLQEEIKAKPMAYLTT